MTLIAVALLFGRMMETIYFPFADTMTDPAIVSEQPVMWIKVTGFTSQILMQEGVIHTGNLLHWSMFLVASNTVFSCKMESNCRPEQRRVVKFMAIQTHLIGNASPWNMAIIAARVLSMH
jgi:hypothetical protein